MIVTRIQGQATKRFICDFWYCCNVANGHIDFMLFLTFPPWGEQPLEFRLLISTWPGSLFVRSFYCEFSGLFCLQMIYHSGDNLNLRQCEAVGCVTAACIGRAFVARRSDKLLPSCRESSCAC